jgi:hypothetical protein
MAGNRGDLQSARGPVCLQPADVAPAGLIRFWSISVCGGWYERKKEARLQQHQKEQQERRKKCPFGERDRVE